MIKSSTASSDTYLDEYKKPFVEKWDELIDWEKRAESEDGFFQKILREHECTSVLDAAAGTGFHSIMLAKDGFNVTAADGAENMLTKTKENAREWKVDLDTVRVDWRWLTESVPAESFDSVLCLGNAFTHLYDAEARRRTLREFYNVLDDGGLCIIDQRNYDAILKEGYSSKHQYYYCGETVDVYPESISEEMVRFRYAFADGSVHHLSLYPVLQDELTEGLLEAGFKKVWRYGDFEAEYDKFEPDFIVQVALK